MLILVPTFRGLDYFHRGALTCLCLPLWVKAIFGLSVEYLLRGVLNINDHGALHHFYLMLFFVLFFSPINDLLEKGGFTLDQLLEEDELIQEVKSKNDKLIEL